MREQVIQDAGEARRVLLLDLQRISVDYVTIQVRDLDVIEDKKVLYPARRYVGVAAMRELLKGGDVECLKAKYRVLYV
jgi:hypothetical protein